MGNKKQNKFTFIYSCVVCLTLPFLLTACKAEESNKNNIITTVVEDIDEKNEAVSEIESDTTMNSILDITSNEALQDGWPDTFSLYEAYMDYFLIGTIYTEDSRSGYDKELTLIHFNAITPENLMKPEYMQPMEGIFKFEQSDELMQFARDYGLDVVGHTLVWHQQSGNWLGKHADRDIAEKQLENHITQIVGQYKGQVLSWDVVNEAIDDSAVLPSDGDWTKCLRKTQWLSTIGPDYLALAFNYAHEADPDAKLYYNDYNLNNKNKADIVYAMVKDLKEQGVPIDGIGMQGHYNTKTSVGSVAYSLDLFKQLDVEISITELDVSVNGAASTGLTTEQEIEQGIVYAKLFRLFKEYKDVINRVTFWGYIDSKSWRADKYPCLFNKDFTAKEAAYAVLNPEQYLALHNSNEYTQPVRTIDAKYGTPTIDGKLDDIWQDSTEAKVNKQLMAWEGATGKIRLLWDEKYLYALFEVKDSDLNADSVNVYEQDSIEIFLDQNNHKNVYYEMDDGQYRVNYLGEESFGTVPNAQGFQSAAIKTKDGYMIELAIPFTIEVGSNMVLGFDAQINDSNSSGVRQSIVKFNDTTDNSWQSCEYWGEVKLSK